MMEISENFIYFLVDTKTFEVSAYQHTHFYEKCK